MKKFLSSAVFAGLCFLSATPAQSAIELSQVAADANWVIYADLNAIRSSVLGKDLMALLTKQQMDKTGGILSLNVPKVLETIGSITAYGTCSSVAGSSENKDVEFEKAALVVQGTEKLKKIVEAVLIEQSVEKPAEVIELKDFPYTAYGINHKGKNGANDGQLIVAFPPEPVVLVSESKAQITKALDVFSGRSESLAKAANPSALTQMVREAGDVPLFGASSVLPKARNSTKTSRILQLASGGLLAFGEKGENTFARAMLLSSSEDTAGKLLKILQGLAAMVSLAESTDKQLTEFLNSVTVEKHNEAVTLDISYPSVRVSQILKTIQQAQANKRQKARTESSKNDASDSSSSAKGSDKSE